MRREADPDYHCPQAALVDEETQLRTERRLARYRAKIAAQEAATKMMIESRQRKQMIWMAGGALALAMISWIWRKRSNGLLRKQRRKREEGESFDWDFADNASEEEVLENFDKAVNVARSFPESMLDQRDQLMLYGLYKQASIGERNIPQPSKLNFVASAKYDAWGKFSGLPKEFAMRKYCEVVHHFYNGGESIFQKDENSDVVYDDDDNCNKELDEDGCPLIESNTPDEPMMSGMGLRPSTLSGVLNSNSTNLGLGGISSINSEENGSPEERLRNAVISADVESLKKAISNGARLDDADESGLTATHFAADRGDLDCLKLLVDAGANVNAVDSDGTGILQTALVASNGENLESVRFLLEAGADPDSCDEDGISPRMLALEEGNEAMKSLFGLFPKR